MRPAKARGPLRPHWEIFPAEKKPWGPRPQLSTKVERHHQGASQLPRQPKAPRLLSASTPPSGPQSWNSDSRKTAIPYKLQASADTQNLQPQSPLREEASRSRGKDQTQRHRPLQPTAAYSRPSAVRAPSRRPGQRGRPRSKRPAPTLPASLPVRREQAKTATGATHGPTASPHSPWRLRGPASSTAYSAGAARRQVTRPP